MRPVSPSLVVISNGRIVPRLSSAIACASHRAGRTASATVIGSPPVATSSASGHSGPSSALSSVVPCTTSMTNDASPDGSGVTSTSIHARCADPLPVVRRCSGRVIAATASTEAVEAVGGADALEGAERVGRGDRPREGFIGGAAPQLDERLALAAAALRVGQVDADVDALARGQVE